MAKQTFNEANIENMFIDAAQKCGWHYIPATEIERQMEDVLVESWLREALIALNNISADQADQVIYKMRSYIQSATKETMVQNNNAFRRFLFDENSFPFGKDGENINICFFDEEDMSRNYCVVTNQWVYPRTTTHGGKRLDLVFIINGIPMVIGEVKTPFAPGITWADGANDIVKYQKSIPAMFVTNILNFASDG